MSRSPLRRPHARAARATGSCRPPRSARGPRRSSPSTRPTPTSLAAVLPPPLEPTGDAAREGHVATGRHRPAGLPPFGAGTFSVQARHEGTVGWYPLRHADDHRAVGHRRPRDLRRAEEARPRSRSSATATGSRGTIARLGTTFVEVAGTRRRRRSRPPTAPAPTSTSSSCPRPTARASTPSRRSSTATATRPPARLDARRRRA